MYPSALAQQDIRSIHRAVARTWSDSHFRDYFLEKPKEVLLDLGVVLSDRLKVIATLGSSSCDVVSIQEDRLNITLPSIPEDIDDTILDPHSIDVSFSLKICCTCLEVDTQKK